MRFAMVLAALAALWVQPATAATIHLANGCCLLNPVLEQLTVRGATPGAEVAAPQWPAKTWFSFGITDASGNLDWTGSFAFLSTKYGFYNLPISASEPGDYGAFESQWQMGTVTQVVTGLRAPPVPEPSTWAMMILGFGLVGGALRRRQLSVKFPPLPALTPSFASPSTIDAP